MALFHARKSSDARCKLKEFTYFHLFLNAAASNNYLLPDEFSAWNVEYSVMLAFSAARAYYPCSSGFYENYASCFVLRSIKFMKAQNSLNATVFHTQLFSTWIERIQIGHYSAFITGSKILFCDRNCIKGAVIKKLINSTIFKHTLSNHFPRVFTIFCSMCEFSSFH